MSVIKLFRGRLRVDIPFKKEVVAGNAKAKRKAITMAVAKITCEIPGAPKGTEIPLGSGWPVKTDQLAAGKRLVAQWIENNVVRGRDYKFLMGETAAEVGKILFEALHTDKDWYVQVLKVIRDASNKGDQEATDGLWAAAHLEAKWREKIGETNPLMMGFYDMIAKGIFGGLAGAFGGVSNALKSTPGGNQGTAQAADLLAIASGGGTPPQQQAATGALVNIQARAQAGDPQAIAAMNNLQRANYMAQQPQFQQGYAPQPYTAPGGGYVLPLRG